MFNKKDNVIIVGCGNLGSTLAGDLSYKGYDITVIDINRTAVKETTNAYDIMGVIGNCTSMETLSEAGIEDADILIAVTGSDEINLLTCLIGKKMAHYYLVRQLL